MLKDYLFMRTGLVGRGAVSSLGPVAALLLLLVWPHGAHACENVLLAAGYDYFFNGSIVLAIFAGPFLFGIADLYYRRILLPAFKREITSSALRVAALILLPIVAAPWFLLGYSCALAYALKFENGFGHGLSGAGAFLGVWILVGAANILLWNAGRGLIRRIARNPAFQRASVTTEQRSALSKAMFVFWIVSVIALILFIPTPKFVTSSGGKGFLVLGGLALLSGAPFLFHQLFIGKDIERFAPGSAERTFLGICTVIGGVAASGVMLMLLAIVYVAYASLGVSAHRMALAVAFTCCTGACFLLFWLVSVVRKSDSKISV